jgi:hypothetical protein
LRAAGIDPDAHFKTKEGLMAKDLVPVRAPASAGLHPMIYAAIGLLMCWLVLWAFLAFSDTGYTEFLLVVVAGFFLMVATIPFAIWRMWRKYSGGRMEGEGLRDWAEHDFAIEPGRMKGKDAAIEALLPIAAVSFGMMAIAIVLIATWHYSA